MVSPVWSHFTNDKTIDKATCHHCAIDLCTKNGNTSNLRRHLDAKHPAEFATTQGDFKILCEKIVRFVTVQNTSFRMVESPEFKDLFPSSTRMPSRFHLSDVVLPSMVETLRETILEVSFHVYLLQYFIYF